MRTIVQISKTEKDYLESRGYKWHVHIFGSNTKHRKYYAIESRDVLKKIKNYRKNIIIKE